MKIRKIHCLFEQSGTFKNAAKELGVEAEDYDILDDFGETDHQIDLFAEIDKAYDGKPSIFDGIEDCDLILAFFPCTRFECQSKMLLDGSKNGTQKWTDLQKVEYAMKTTCPAGGGQIQNDRGEPIQSAALPDGILPDKADPDR